MNQFYEYFPGLLLIYAAFGLGLLTPGPNILAVIGTSMSVNRKSGVALATGIACGTFLWSLLAAVGLAALLVKFTFALFYLKVAGGLYLLWLAYRGFRSAISSDAAQIRTDGAGVRSSMGYLLQGLMVQMTNPKAALAWFAILPLCIDAHAPLWVWAAVVGGTTALSVVGHLAYAVAFSTASAVAAYRKARRLVESGIGAFFTFAGLKLLLSNS